jgi:DNA-binding HxlR family transcriptional regulator
MRHKSFEDMRCSIAQTLEVVGERWTLLIVRDLFMGVTRFDEIQRRLGVARNILTDRLSGLMEAGVISRVPYQQNPERFDYQLTAKGRDLWKVETTLRDWGDRWAAPDGAPVDLLHDDCGGTAELVLTCSKCGGLVDPGHVHLAVGPGAGDDPVLPPQA